MEDPRPDWDTYYLSIAAVVSSRADCTRRQVGAVIVQGDRIVSTGYNGAPAGKPGCLTAAACPRGRMSKTDILPGSSYDTGAGACIALHAEQNAIIRAGLDARGSTLYLTHPPCDGCGRLIEGSGIARVVYMKEEDLNNASQADRQDHNGRHYPRLSSSSRRSVLSDRRR